MKGGIEKWGPAGIIDEGRAEIENLVDTQSNANESELVDKVEFKEDFNV